MTRDEAIRGRRSVRKFLDKTIPQETLREIMDGARWSPSWGNTQPWTFSVITGAPLAELKKAIQTKMAQGEAYNADIPMPETWPEALKNRYSETGKLILSSMSIAREDKASRNRFYEEMAVLFGAPCLVVGSIPKGVRVEYAMLDMGLILQTICLAAWDRGVASCIMAASVGYPSLLRQMGGVPHDRLVAMGIALGYADNEAPINRFSRIRMDLEEMTTWVG